MKTITTLISAITVFVVSQPNKANAQNKTRPFKQIEYAAYTINSPNETVRDKITIHYYAKISSDGSIGMADVNNRLNTTDYYKYQLDTEKLKQIEAVFNDQTELKTLMVAQHLPPGWAFSGEYEYFLVKYLNGKSDSISYIQKFMSPKFMHAVEILTDILYHEKMKPTKNMVRISPQFMKSVLLSFKKSKYLPPID